METPIAYPQGGVKFAAGSLPGTSTEKQDSVVSQGAL
jgi:hypothetical protein